MQPFSDVQPTAALVEPDQDTGLNASDEVSTDFATTQVDNRWITEVYRGDLESQGRRCQDVDYECGH